ncbi:hypothetical protein F0562_024687 [Nyssa sinensis]|uniref:Uncharacterized protein n=1 Tax=Nyssa sinensis TaxID=561372 RepID=A0A5J5BCL1_9ASTE|nr:hypothetical protein F0562_024687 [Nyssa sinensis]
MMDRHILLLTFPGQGAIDSALQLAKHLIRMGVKVHNFTTIEGLIENSKVLRGVEKRVAVYFLNRARVYMYRRLWIQVSLSGLFW